MDFMVSRFRSSPSSFQALKIRAPGDRTHDPNLATNWRQKEKQKNITTSIQTKMRNLFKDFFYSLFRPHINVGKKGKNAHMNVSCVRNLFAKNWCVTMLLCQERHAKFVILLLPCHEIAGKINSV